MNKRITTSLLCATLLAFSMNSYAGCRGDASRLLGQGMLYANMKDFGNAISSFKASIKCKRTATAYSNLGASYMQIGKINLALSALKEAERINSRDSMVLYNLAAAHSITDQTDLALAYLDRALANGFNHYEAIRFDPDLTNLRGEPEFRTTLEKHKVFIQ